MRLMIIALFLFAFVVPGVAQQQSAPTGAKFEVLVAVAGSDNGAAFLRRAKPTLERLAGRVKETDKRRNTVLGRDETEITFVFNSEQSGQNFMQTLAAGDGGGATAASVSFSCSKEGWSKVCYFKIFDRRFVCVQSGNAGAACAEM